MGGPGQEAPEEATLLLIDDDGQAIAALFGAPEGAPGDWRLVVAAAGGEGVLRNGVAARGRRSLESVIRLDVAARVHLVLVRPGGRTS